MNTQYLNYMQTPAMMEALINSSVSAEDANLRSREYAKMFSRNDDMKEMAGAFGNSSLSQKMFSGYSETPLLSTQYFNASVASYVSSFAGFMSVERDFDQPNGLFYWFDVLGVTDYRKVIPNLGPDNYQDINTMGGFEFSVNPTSSTAYSAGTINYVNGKVEFTLVTALAGDSVSESITITGKEDVTGTPSNANGASNAHANDKRFMAKMQQLGLQTVPDMLMAEYNIASLGAMKKATGADMATFLFTKLRELYTKSINYKLVSTLVEGYQGNTMTDLDLSTATMQNTFYDYRSRIDMFDAYLVNVETALAKKAVKGCDVTAYVAGPNACNQFQKGSVTGKWDRNTKMSYINDLLGWYNGIPVLRSTDIEETPDGGVQTGTFYAIHKTHDGQMAPLARGIYMPLTDTPTIGNYNNPTQMASGIYYQEGTKYMAQELVQKVTFKLSI